MIYWGLILVTCPYCHGTCILCNSKTDPYRNIKKKTDASGTLLGAFAGLILGGLPGIIVGAIAGSFANSSYYECTKCHRKFKSLEDIRSRRC